MKGKAIKGRPALVKHCTAAVTELKRKQLEHHCDLYGFVNVLHYQNEAVNP